VIITNVVGKGGDAMFDRADAARISICQARDTPIAAQLVVDEVVEHDDVGAGGIAVVAGALHSTSSQARAGRAHALDRLFDAAGERMWLSLISTPS
jgi:hypothetical protein